MLADNGGFFDVVGDIFSQLVVVFLGWMIEVVFWGMDEGISVSYRQIIH